MERTQIIMHKKTSILRTLKKRSFQNNKGRNLAAVFAILMTAMMFTTLFTLAQSMSKNAMEMYFRQTGTTAHASTKKITDGQISQIASHPDITDSGWSIVLGISENQALLGRQAEIRYATDSYAEYAFAYPETGKMPENKDEIALDTLTLERLGITPALGEPVTLTWRKDTNSPEITSSTFVLCGWWEGNRSSYAGMAWVSKEFALEACGNIQAPPEGQVCGLRMMSISFADSNNLEEKVASLLKDCGITDVEFTPNLTYSPEIQQSLLQESLPMYGGMVLVFLAGYLIIYNIFQISVAADIHFYGQLKTLGAAKKQLRAIIFSQGNRLSLIGIPLGLLAGFLLGVLLVPALIATPDFTPSVSVNPVIFAGSALFSYLTVTVSCLLPARAAGKVSPMEALRYTDSGSDPKKYKISGKYKISKKYRISKKYKKAKKGASLPAMAWANLWRSRKRTFIVLSSLTLGLVLMSYFYGKNASFDIEKYLTDLAVADYELDDATNNLAEGYDPESQSISNALVSDIRSLENLEETGRLYSRQCPLTPSAEAGNNLQNYYSPERLEDFASYDPTFPEWKKGFDLAVSGAEVPCTVYGADGPVLEAAASGNYILDGAYDQEAFATGDYCLAIGPSIDPGKGVPTFTLGERIEIGGREFEVMAVLSPLRPMVSGSGPAFDLPLVITADAFTELWPDSNLRKFYFNVGDESLEEADTLLSEYQKASAPGMNIVSRQSIRAQYEAQTRSSSVMGYAISSIIALVGVLNFINSMVTAIISRKREFAMIQSIGMTKRQLSRMLTFEGLYYAGLTLLISYLLSALAVGVLVRQIAEVSGYSTFHFTLLPLLLCTPALIFLAVLIPYLCFKNLEKTSIVERLRETGI